MRWVKRLLIGLVVLALLVLACGAAFQWWSTSRDTKQFGMTGRLVDIGDRHLHLVCTGDGAPLVLLETGAGKGSSAWASVQEQVARFTRVCSYDRAGYGWSDRSDQPFTASFVADDLEALRRSAGLNGPVVLVGWSIGGRTALQYVYDHPDSVVGLLLIEARLPQEGRLYAIHNLLANDSAFMPTLKFCKTVAWTGLLRVIHFWDGQLDAMGASPATRALTYRTGWCAAISREFAGIPGMTSSPNAPRSLGALPLIVLMRGLPGNLSVGSLRRAPAELVQRYDSVWHQLQAEAAALSTDSRLEVVAGSDHQVPLRRPEAVVAAVRDLVERARKGP